MGTHAITSSSSKIKNSLASVANAHVMVDVVLLVSIVFLQHASLNQSMLLPLAEGWG